MIIRQVNINDVEELKKLYAQLNPKDEVVESDIFSLKLLNILRTEGMRIFVCEVDGKLVSTCYLNIISNLTRSLRPYAVMENVVTDKNSRGKGYGKAVVLHALEYAKSNNCYKVMLMTGSKRDSVLGFYKNCGFKTNVKTAFYISYLNNN